MATVSFLLFLVVSPVIQTLQGTILDPSGAAVRNALIELTAGSTTVRNVTDSEGHFSFEMPPGTYRLEVGASGFAPYVHDVSVPSILESITLRVASQIDDITVTATRSETPPGLIGVTATVIPGAEIGARQLPAVSDLLRNVPGLTVANTNRRGGSTSVYTRGGGKNSNLVLIDGIQVNDPGGDFNFAHLTSAAVERIEIVRGPQSALFGSDAAAAVIQLVSKRGSASDGRASGVASLETGNFDTKRYTSRISGILNRWDYAVGAEQMDTSGEYPNDAYRNLTLSLNTGFAFTSTDAARFTFRRIGSHVGVPNRVGFGIVDGDASRRNRLFVSGVTYEHSGPVSHRLKLGWTHSRDVFTDFMADGPFTVRALVSGVRLIDILPPSADPSTVLVPPNSRLVTRTVRLSPTPEPSIERLQRRTVEYQGTWNYRMDSRLIGGYEFENESGINSSVRPVRNNHGWFLNHEHPIGRRLYLNESVRLERNSAFHTKATPRLSGSYALTPSLRVAASIGTGITEPSFLQNFANNPTFVGNRSLRPERSRSAEAGIEQQILRSRLMVGATLFHNSFRDLIVFTSMAPPLVSTWQNIDTSRARGAELRAHLRTRIVQVRGEYTFLDTRTLTSVSQELPRRPRHSAAIDSTSSIGRFTANLLIALVGERQDSDGVGLGVTRNAGYRRADVSGSYRLRESVDVVTRVENIFNARYMEVLGYNSLSRTLTAGLRVRWGTAQ